jgi:hypothetical protein
MASKEFAIPFPKGYYMSWFITTQAANKITATLIDDAKTYFSGSRQNTLINPPLAINADFVAADHLRVSIDSDGASQLKDRQNVSIITNDKGNEVGRIYNLCIEDWVDEDYNDVSVSLIAWKSKG